MASAHDVAAYILERLVPRRGPITAMKLQKLIYYAQAWHLVWDEEPLFSEKVEAWALGPVVRELFERHRGQFKVARWEAGDSSRLSDEEKTTIDAVLDFYGAKSSQELSDLTHLEDPWIRARRGLGPDERGSREIRHAWMFEYYSSIVGAA